MPSGPKTNSHTAIVLVCLPVFRLIHMVTMMGNKRVSRIAVRSAYCAKNLSMIRVFLKLRIRLYQANIVSNELKEIQYVLGKKRTNDGAFDNEIIRDASF